VGFLFHGSKRFEVGYVNGGARLSIKKLPLYT